MITKFMRKVSAAAVAIAVSMSGIGCVTVSAETGDDDSAVSKSAVLQYDNRLQSFVILDADGKEFDTDFYDSAEQPEDNSFEENDAQTVAAVTTGAVTTTNTVTTATTTTTVTKPLSPAATVNEYTGRYRDEATLENDGILNAFTTVTTTIVTTETTTVVTKKSYNGIDVSRYQGDINWTKVKNAGIDFVMIRAGYGKEYDQVDMKFHQNIAGAQAAGIDCGVYWYSYALSTADALREAKVCCNTIQGYKLTYPVAFDIEDPSQKHLTVTEMSNITKTFCDYLEEQRYFVTIYSYASILRERLNMSALSKYDVWVAHTGVDKPNYSGYYGMWQYSWTGRVDGINTDVDLDKSYVYYPAIMREYKLNGFT